MTWRPTVRHTLGLVGALSCCLAAGVGFWLFCQHMRQGAITADWPWLYRAGQTLWASGLPENATMTWTFGDHPWVLYQWLFEAVAAPVYGLLGPTLSALGVCLLGLFMYMLWPAWYLARRGVHPLITLAIGGLVLIPVSINFGLRPMLATNLALMAQIMVVENLRDGRIGGRSAAAAIAGIYVLWANTHLGFTIGLTSLILYALADLLPRWAPTVGPRLSPRGVLGRYAALLLVAVAAIGVNPYGWSLFPYIIDLSLKTTMNSHIHELKSPDPSNPYILTGIVMLLVYAVLALVHWRRLAWVGLFHVLLFVIGTADSLRMVVWAGLFFVLAAPPLVQQSLPRWAAWPGGWRLDRRPGPVIAIATTAAALFIAGPVSAWTIGGVRLAGCEYQAEGIRLLDRRLPAGAHWFASERTGSCTHFYAPARGVFIDTRFDMYPESFVLDWFEAYQHRRDWRALFDRWQIEAVLLTRNAPLVPTLSAPAAGFTREAAGPNMWLFTADTPPRAGRAPTGSAD